MSRQAAVVLTLLLSTLAAPGDAQTRRALLVGIDDYTASQILRPAAGQAPVAPGRSIWRDLSGAVNDARALRDLLVSRYGFHSGDVHLLTNQEAGRRAILEAIQKHLIAPTQKGDTVLFFYAGHGSQVLNSRSEEPDRRDETIVPADSRLGAQDIRDKELRRLFNEILDRGARLTVILDSCHSGSGARGLPSRAPARALPLDPRDIRESSPSGPRPEERGALILSAAQDGQLAREVTDTTGVKHGAFSLALIEALGRSEIQTPVEQIFLRARALLQMRNAIQEPVLAGNEARRSQPLFGGSPGPPVGGRIVAVRRIDPDGTIILQGGWANGLREGTVLALRARPGSVQVKIRVTAVQGPVTAKAKLVASGSAREVCAPGDLFELAGWAIASEPSLRVWIPEAGARWEKIVGLARDLQARTTAAGFAWIQDPVTEAPTHVLSWEQGGWNLTGPVSETEALGADPAAVSIVRKLADRPPVRLFVHLPARVDVAKAIQLGIGTQNTAVVRTDGPEEADYVLVGRWHRGAVEFAWIHPEAGAEDRKRPLPGRSDWHALSRKDSLSRQLEDSALRIAKLRAWLTLEPPPGNEFPYHLVLKDSQGRSVAPGTPLAAGTTYGLALSAQPRDLARRVRPRHVYVFALNSSGASVLLFPPATQGNVENLLPLLRSGRPLPSEMLLGRQPSFRVGEPLGIDTYFLLTSEEPLPNPWVLAFPGVRTRAPEGATPLEELLAQQGTASRRTPPVTPVTWSIERRMFRVLR